MLTLTMPLKTSLPLHRKGPAGSKGDDSPLSLSEPHTSADAQYPSVLGPPSKHAPTGKNKAGGSHKTSPEMVPADDPTLLGKMPKRTSSFGRGLGASLANGVSRAGHAMPGIGKSRSGSNPSTPTAGSGVFNFTPVQPVMTPDPSHLAQFSLRLSELVNKAFAPCSGGHAVSGATMASGVAGAAKSAAGAGHGVPSVESICCDGKKLPLKARVIEIAETVVGELTYAASVDAYLLRAVSRQILKALTLFATRIDSLLVPASLNTVVFRIPTNAKEGVHLPVAMEFNLALVMLEWIVEDSLERCIEGRGDELERKMPPFVAEILTPVRKKMEGTILHVVQPLLAALKSSLTACVSKAVPTPFYNAVMPSPVATPSSEVPPSIVATMSGSTSLSKQDSAASWTRELEGRLDGARRLLVPRIVERSGQDGEGWFISVAVHLIWKGLLILTARPCDSTALGSALSHSMQQTINDATKRSPSPAQLASALKAVGAATKSKRNDLGSGSSISASGRATPSLVGAEAVKMSSSSEFGSSQSRIGALKATSTQQLADLQTFEKLVTRFVAGFTSDRKGGVFQLNAENDDGESDDDDDGDELARAALGEALQAVRSTIVVVQALDANPDTVLAALGPTHTSDAARLHLQVSPEVRRAFKAIPPLMLVQLTFARLPLAPGRVSLPTPPALFNYTWAEYEKAIAGFAGGESWAAAVARGMAPEVEHAWKELGARTAGSADGHGHAADAVHQADNLVRSSSSHSTASRPESESSESLNEAMTMSAPTLPRRTSLDAELASPRIRQPRSTSPSPPSTATGPPNANLDSITSAAATATKPDRSPSSSSAAAVAATATSGPTQAPPRFWRRSTSSRGFHLPSLSRTSSPAPSSGRTRGRAAPTSRVVDDGLTEEERARVEMGADRRALINFARTLESVVPDLQIALHAHASALSGDERAR